MTAIIFFKTKNPKQEFNGDIFTVPSSSPSSTSSSFSSLSLHNHIPPPLAGDQSKKQQKDLSSLKNSSRCEEKRQGGGVSPNPFDSLRIRQSSRY